MVHILDPFIVLVRPDQPAMERNFACRKNRHDDHPGSHRFDIGLTAYGNFPFPLRKKWNGIFLLHPQQNLSIAPELFEIVILAHIWREEMNDYIPVIQNQPAFFSSAFDAPFLLMLLLRYFQHAFGERVEHAVTGAIADNEIIGK